MSDIRQKLLPVFLEEAGRKIALLDGFFGAVVGAGRSLHDLEAAFRAAHTLKGTAALVQAEAVRALSARIEGLLESHFEKARFPSEIEYEAMRLALDRLRLLIAAVARHQEEPAGLLIEAELALKLAAAFPGRKNLAELLEPRELVDPFAEDPALQAEAVGAQSGASVRSGLPLDPFAEDPALEAVIDLFEHLHDPFAEDPALESALPLRQDSEESWYEPLSADPGLMTDPFAEDPVVDSEAEAEAEALAAVTPDLRSRLFVELSESEPVAAVELALMARPEEEAEGGNAGPAELLRDESVSAFEPAEVNIPEVPVQESFIERMRKRIEKEDPIEMASRLAGTLQRQDEGVVATRNYRCCHFRVANKDYFLPIANMIEIADLSPIIRLPLAPPAVRGLMNLRGQVLPVIDLSLQFGSTSTFVAVRKLVIAEANGEKLAFLAEGIPDLAEEVCGEKVDVMNFVDQFRAGAS
jgi:chemotaxis protein histidine kinase CheA